MGPENIGIVHIWDLPKDRVYIKLKPRIHLNIISQLKNKYNSLAEISRKTNISYSIIKKFVYRTRAVSYKDFERINKLLNQHLTKNEIEKSILFLTLKSGGNGIINPKLPFNFNNESGVMFISALLHDGGISNKLQPNYRNDDEEIMKRVYNCAEDIFGKIKMRRKIITEYAINFPIIVGLTMVYGLGMKHGNKVMTNPIVPIFMKRGNEKLKIAYLKQAFDDDGWVSSTTIGLTISIDSSIFQNKKTIGKEDYKMFNLFKTNREFLKDIGFESGIILQRTRRIINNKIFIRYVWRICISGRDNIFNFYKKIDFRQKKRKRRLKELINKYIKTEKSKFMPYTAINNTLKAMNILEKKFGYFTSELLAKQLNRSRNLACTRIIEFKVNRLVKQISKRKKGEFVKYQLSKKGREKIDKALGFL